MSVIANHQVARMRADGVIRLMELQEEGWSYIRP
jgi:intracellular sulfur oxidation DsrE/DsrF family protein